MENPPSIVRQMPLIGLVAARENDAPISRRHADAMLAVTDVMRRQALQLPEGDDLRAEFLTSAADYRLAAQLAWPPYQQARPAGLPQPG